MTTTAKEYNPRDHKVYPRVVRLRSIREDAALILKELKKGYEASEGQLLDEAIFDLQMKYLNGKGAIRPISQTVRGLFTRGWSPAEIGRKLGLTPSHVLRLLKRTDPVPKPKKKASVPKKKDSIHGL